MSENSTIEIPFDVPTIRNDEYLAFDPDRQGAWIIFDPTAEELDVVVEYTANRGYLSWPSGTRNPAGWVWEFPAATADNANPAIAEVARVIAEYIAQDDYDYEVAIPGEVDQRITAIIAGVNTEDALSVIRYSREDSRMADDLVGITATTTDSEISDRAERIYADGMKARWMWDTESIEDVLRDYRDELIADNN